jgi:hypothetical protein
MFKVLTCHCLLRNQWLFTVMLLMLSHMVFADGIFVDRKKAQHDLSGVELNRIKAEHQIRFGQKVSTSQNFGVKNKAQQAQVQKASWSDCRNYALHKRNRCYRDGRDAYRCEQMYDARVTLCNTLL